MDENVQHELQRRYLKTRLEIAAQLLELSVDDYQTHAQKNGAMKLVASWLKQIASAIDFRATGPDDIPF